MQEATNPKEMQLKNFLIATLVIGVLNLGATGYLIKLAIDNNNSNEQKDSVNHGIDEKKLDEFEKKLDKFFENQDRELNKMFEEKQ